MFGVIFDGHPGLVPLLLPDSFEGLPLRKDFALAARGAQEWPGAKEPGEQAGARGRRRIPAPAVQEGWPALHDALELPARQPRGDRAARGELHRLHAVRPGVPGLVHLHRVAQGAGPVAGAGRAAARARRGGPPGGAVNGSGMLDRFAIDFSLCMYCGICIEVCPYDALFWAPEFSYAEPDIRELTHERGRLRSWMDDGAAAARPRSGCAATRKSAGRGPTGAGARRGASGR